MLDPRNDSSIPTDATQAPLAEAPSAATRRRSVRKAQAVVDSIAAPADSFRPTDPGAADPADGSAAPAPRTARRRRSATAEAQAEAPSAAVQPTLEIGPVRASAKAITAEPPAKAITAAPGRDPAGDQPTSTAWVEAPDPAPVRSRRGRRSAETTAAEAPAVPVVPVVSDQAVAESGDAIAEALQELSQTLGRSARRRRQSEGDSRQGETLDQLAAAIADDAGAVELTAEPANGGDEAEEDDSGHRRRRRRGGRRHRRGEVEAGAGESDEADGAGSDETETDGAESNGAGPNEAGSNGAGPEGAKSDEADDSLRRRRRRRHRDEASGEDEAPATGRTRESKAKKATGSVTGIEGSTRLEAKRQRRREGRVASRRRAPILSEAEFLARREAVDRTMVVRQSPGYSQIAVLEDGILVEHYVDRAESTSLIGNVYLGRVQNVLPSMEAAFVDIGRGRNAVLFAGEVDWDSLGVEGEARKMEDVFTSGQTILVQVTKDPIGAKGARLTSHISIPGRYIVYAPGGHLAGISRKLADQERARLKSILDNLVGEKASVIIRTAAEGATTDELVHDINRLKAQWEVIEKKTKKGGGAQLLYSEPDLTMRIVRDLFTGDFSELVVDGDGSMTDAFDTVEAYVQHVAPNLSDRVRRWDRSQGDLFARYRIDEQIAKALDRKVHLPSGGTLIIDRTEAMTVIDVNTGKFTGSGGTLEATVTSNNLEAAEEIVRQLRLRDIGGIVVIDFIDMVLPANRELLLKRLVECLSRDRTRHQVSEVTSLGLVQLTRKRVGTGLAEAFTTTCDHCGGLGYLCQNEPVDNRIAPDGGDRSGRRNNNRRGKDRD
ncbi:MAG: Rne/Rng family ribonuclease [Propionibacteriaceae bacterium]|jgi:ribonuclease E|nr:Rne/Rng family ribonuclease [Propionibacteriaceae bacterium]